MLSLPWAGFLAVACKACKQGYLVCSRFCLFHFKELLIVICSGLISCFSFIMFSRGGHCIKRKGVCLREKAFPFFRSWNLGLLFTLGVPLHWGSQRRRISFSLFFFFGEYIFLDRRAGSLCSRLSSS